MISLSDSFSPELWARLDAVIAEADKRSVALYIVGGYVRDLLLTGAAAPNPDLDIVVEGDAIALVRALVARYGGAITDHPPFGTATWFPPDAPSIDFATTRTEIYTQPAALPTVSVLTAPGSLTRDLARRDFTMNTLALRLTPRLGEIIDLYDGRADLNAGIIRVLHDQSFIDDPTRIFRAARFAARFGFRLEPHTHTLMVPALPHIKALSGQRLFHELDLILAEPHAAHALALLSDWRALTFVDKGLEIDEWFLSVFTSMRIADLTKDNRRLIGWILLCCRLQKPDQIIARLGLSRTLADPILQGADLYKLLPRLNALHKPSEATHAIESIAKPPSEAALRAASAMTTDDSARSAILNYLKDWQFVKPTLTGHDLTAMGLPRGPLFGKLLHRLRDARLDGEITNPEQERAAVERWLAE